MCLQSSGTDGIQSPHGLPMDLLNRILIIKTEAYSSAEIAQILQIRADVEGVKLDQTGLDALTEVGNTASLRLVDCVFLPLVT
jgi:DNA helicase TIP49 (TBP-interacting protein)